MKKRDKIYDSPEYKQIKEHLPEILKELERDNVDKSRVEESDCCDGDNWNFDSIFE